MPTFTYYNTHARDRNYDDYYDLSPPSTYTYPTVPHPPTRRNSTKRIYTCSDDDEDNLHDDYPYSTTYKPLSRSANHSSSTSRALIPRNQPSQLEKYNVWSETDHGRSAGRHHSRTPISDDEGADDDADFRLRYRTTTVRPAPSRQDSYKYAAAAEQYDSRDREYRLKFKATYTPSRSSRAQETSSSASKGMHWPGELFRRKEKYEDEMWMSREREMKRGGASWMDEEREREKTVRFRSLKRTKTEEWKPLSGRKIY